MIYPSDLPPSVLGAAEVLLRAIDATGAVPVPDTPVEERAKAVALVVVAMYDPDAELEVRDRTESPSYGTVLTQESLDDEIDELRLGKFLRDAETYAERLIASGHCKTHLVKNCRECS